MTVFPLLDVASFTCVKAGRFLCKNLSFQLKSGEALVFTGSNGSGKTTLLRCLAGIPDALPGITKDTSLTQSYVGHLNALKGLMTVRQNLSTQTGAAPEKLASLLGDRGLDFLADRRVDTLSAGQRRQVALVRLPLSGAALWLVDEPTTHLDERAAMQFWNGVDAHLKKGGIAVLTSHGQVPLPHAKVIHLHG